MDKISVFLADWQVLFREGIHFTLSGEEDIDVIGEATENDDAFKQIQENTPTVAVLNSNHNNNSGISLTRRIRQNYPSVSVILIMDNEDEDIYFSALKCGASACVTKNIDPEDIVALIRNISRGANPVNEVIFRPGMAAKILEEFENFTQLDSVTDNMLAGLSAHENSILQMIAAGDSLDMIAAKLSVEKENVKKHLDTVLFKLVKNDYSRELIEAAQRNMGPVKMPVRGKKGVEYVSREEFDAFKESIKDRFRAFLGELN